jgi:hypothetical protein
MNLKPIASNMTEVTTDKATVLFSYRTPVAAVLSNHPIYGSCFIKTNHKWSVTTSKHINKWLEGAKAREVDQSVLDNLV